MYGTNCGCDCRRVGEWIALRQTLVILWIVSLVIFSYEIIVYILSICGPLKLCCKLWGDYSWYALNMKRTKFCICAYHLVQSLQSCAFPHSHLLITLMPHHLRAYMHHVYAFKSVH